MDTVNLLAMSQRSLFRQSLVTRQSMIAQSRSPLLDGGGPVQSQVVVSPDLEVDLHDVEDHGELREEEDSGVGLLHVGQHLVQHLELAALAQLRVAQAEVLDGLQRNGIIMIVNPKFVLFKH